MWKLIQFSNFRCISWILTWLGYHIGSVTFEEICRLFDFFLAAGDKFMPVYFSAAVCCYFFHKPNKLNPFKIVDFATCGWNYAV